MECPSEIICRKTSGCFSTFSPTQKKVALALNCFSVERTHGVISGTGPSSNVRKIFFSLVGMRQTADGYNFLISQFGRTEYIQKNYLRLCGICFCSGLCVMSDSYFLKRSSSSFAWASAVKRCASEINCCIMSSRSSR